MVITNKKQINTQRKGKGKLSRSFRSVWVWAGEAMLARNIGVMCASVFRERTRSRAAPRNKRAQPKPPSETDTSLRGWTVAKRPPAQENEAAAGWDGHGLMDGRR